MVLLGMVPVFTETPPSDRRFSTTATFLPSLAACMAAWWPAGPLPSTRMSKCFIPMGIPPPFAPATAKSLQRYLGPLHVQSAELQGLQDRPGLEMTNIPDRITPGICHLSLVICHFQEIADFAVAVLRSV